MSSTAVYAQVAELRSAIGKGSQAEDALILAYLQAASRAVDRVCNREDGFVALATAVAHVYRGSGLAHQRIDEAASITSVAVKDSPTDSAYTAWATADWIAARGDPSRPDFNHTPYDLLLVDPTGDQALFTSGGLGTLRGFRPHPDDAARSLRGVPTVQVTARWGYALTVPDQVKQATIITAARWFKRGQSSWSDALAPGDFGQLLYQKPIDPDVQMILKLGRLIRPAVA